MNIGFALLPSTIRLQPKRLSMCIIQHAQRCHACHEPLTNACNRNTTSRDLKGNVAAATAVPVVS